MCIQDLIMAKIGHTIATEIPMDTTVRQIMPNNKNRWAFIISGLTAGVIHITPDNSPSLTKHIVLNNVVNQFFQNVKLNGQATQCAWSAFLTAGTASITLIETVFDWDEMLDEIRKYRG